MLTLLQMEDSVILQLFHFFSFSLSSELCPVQIPLQVSFL